MTSSYSCASPPELRAGLDELPEGGLLRVQGVEARVSEIGCECDEHIVALKVFQAYVQQCIALVVVAFVHQATPVTGNGLPEVLHRAGSVHHRVQDSL